MLLLALLRTLLVLALALLELLLVLALLVWDLLMGSSLANSLASPITADWGVRGEKVSLSIRKLPVRVTPHRARAAQLQSDPDLLTDSKSQPWTI